jgi:hypothetical protein
MRTRTLRNAAPVLIGLIVSIATALPSPPTFAQYFRDDFEDGSATDGSPVTWVPEVPPYPVGEQRVEGGSFILTPARVVYAVPDFYETAWEIENDFATDVVLRTQIRALGTSGVGYHVLYARDTTNVDAGQGVFTSAIVSTGGYLALVVGTNLNNTFLSEGTFDDLTTRTHDINLELWLSGEDLRVFAWRDGTPRPTTPRLTALSPLQNVVTGRVGVAFGQEIDIPSISGAFRYFEVAAIPEPTSLGLAALSIMANLCCARRKRR